LGQFQLAIRDYDKALRLDPRFVLGDRIRGLALNELDQHMQAVENYDQGINLSSDFTHAFIGRTLAHAALGNDAAAQQDTDRAVELGANREQMEAGLAEITEQR
jgi:tetratricopeptide (TPR) repeat protein